MGAAELNNIIGCQVFGRYQTRRLILAGFLVPAPGDDWVNPQVTKNLLNGVTGLRELHLDSITTKPDLLNSPNLRGESESGPSRHPPYLPDPPLTLLPADLTSLTLSSVWFLPVPGSTPNSLSFPFQLSHLSTRPPSTTNFPIFAALTSSPSLRSLELDLSGAHTILADYMYDSLSNHFVNVLAPNLVSLSFKYDPLHRFSERSPRDTRNNPQVALLLKSCTQLKVLKTSCAKEFHLAEKVPGCVDWWIGSEEDTLQDRKVTWQDLNAGLMTGLSREAVKKIKICCLCEEDIGAEELEDRRRVESECEKRGIQLEFLRMVSPPPSLYLKHMTSALTHSQFISESSRQSVNQTGATFSERSSLQVPSNRARQILHLTI